MINDEYLKRLALLESGGNPLAQNPNSSAKGLFQFTDATANAYGLSDPLDPMQAEQAVRAFSDDNYNALRNALGRDPTQGELYLAHQQGATGALRLLNNQDKPVTQVLGLQKVINNIPKSDFDENMTAGQFANYWINKFDGNVSRETSDLPDFSDAGIDDAGDFSDQAVAKTPKYGYGAGDDVPEGMGTPEYYLRGMLDYYGGIPDQMMQGIPFVGTYTDEAFNYVDRLLNNDEDANKRLQAYREKIGKYEQDNPLTAMGAQMGGGVVSSAAALPYVAPFVPKGLVKFAEKRPGVTGGIFGGVGNTLYQSGRSHGTSEEAKNNPLLDFGIGFFSGASGAKLVPKLAKGIGDFAGYIDDKAGNAFSNIFAPKATQANRIMPAFNEANPASQNIVSPMVDPQDIARIRQGNVLPLTQADVTQNVNLQRSQNKAYEQGNPLVESVVNLQQKAMQKPFRSVLGDQDIDPLNVELRTNEAFNNLADTVRQSYDDAGKAVGEAYKKAEELGAVRLPIQNMSSPDLPTDNPKSLLQRFYDVMGFEDATPDRYPNTWKALDELQKIADNVTENKQFGATIGELEKWKKNYFNSVKLEGENVSIDSAHRIKKMLNQEYESFLDDMVSNKLIDGDDAAIEAFREARGMASKRFKFAESSPIVEKILDNRQLNGRELVNIFTGAGKLTGKDSGHAIKSMIEFAGPKAPELIQSARQGYMAKILESSLSPQKNRLDPSENLIEFGNMKNTLRRLMVKHTDAFETLFDPTERKYWEQFYKDLELLSSYQTGSKNPSGTGSRVADMTNAIGQMINNPLFKQVPGLVGVTGSLEKAMSIGADSIIKGKVDENAQKLINGYLNLAVKEASGNPAFYGTLSGVYLPKTSSVVFNRGEE